MTISSTLRKAGPYVGNGVATTFAFSFKVFVESDVVVTLLQISNSAESVLTLNSDYTVTLNADQNTNPGGIVTYAPSSTPMASTHKLTITTGVPQTQGTDIPNAGGWYPEVVEDALDKAVILIQQLAEIVARTLRLPVSSTADPTLPVPSGSSAIGWDAAGTALINIALSTGTSLANLAASSGSALIGFIQAGVGAVLRTVQSKLRETVSVTDYGADPTGASDDTAAISAAFKYCYDNGLLCEFPTGTYNIDLTALPATRVAPAMRGRGKVTVNITKSGAWSNADVWTVKDGFSITGYIDFVTTFTYANATANYYHLFHTGPIATSPRLNNCVIEATYRQTTVTDGTARGYGFADFRGGMTNVKVDMVLEGVREGIQIQSDGHDGETLSCVIGGKFNMHGKNMQRVLAIDAIPTTGLMGSTGLDINYSLVNTAAQRDQYPGGARTGHSPLIGDLGLNPKIRGRVQYPIEHAMYIYATRFDIEIYGANMEDLSIKGYSTTQGCSGSIRVLDYRMTAASYTNSHSIVSLQHANGVDIDVVNFKGTNLSGGYAGNNIRPWSVVSLGASAKNVRVKAKGQYLLTGIINYEVLDMEEAYENITVEDCEVLDPHATTSGAGYAALTKFNVAHYPSAGWYSAGDPLFKNLTVRRNYFGVTTETIDTAESTTPLYRGRGGSLLVGLFHCADMAGVRSYDNEMDGWYGDQAAAIQPIGVDSAAAGAAGHVSDVVINEKYHGLTNATFYTLGSNLYFCPGSSIDYSIAPDAVNASGRMRFVKGRSVGAADNTVAEAVTAGCEVEGSITFKLLTTGFLSVVGTTNLQGEYSFHTNTGEYAFGNVANGALTSLHASANADATTDTALKVSSYINSNQILVKNNTAGTVYVTFSLKGAYRS